MKQKIAEVINVNIGEFRIMKSGIKYEEIKDLSLTLYEAGLYKNSKIFIELGKPANVGAINLHIYEATFNHEEDNELFKYSSSQIFDITVNKNASVRELKSLIAQQYSETQLTPDGLPRLIERDMVRIRDKGVERLGKIMRDGKMIKEYDI